MVVSKDKREIDEQEKVKTKTVKKKSKVDDRIKTNESKKESKLDNDSGQNKEEYWATGRRKQAVARVKLTSQEKREIIINHQLLKDYFRLSRWQSLIKQPLVVTKSLNNYKIMANVKGGGLPGQAEAVRHGISRALLKVDEKFRPLLKKAGLLTRDSRSKERKKYGQKGARAKFQFTKR